MSEHISLVPKALCRAKLRATFDPRGLVGRRGYTYTGEYVWWLLYQVRANCVACKNGVAGTNVHSLMQHQSAEKCGFRDICVHGDSKMPAWNKCMKCSFLYMKYSHLIKSSGRGLCIHDIHPMLKLIIILMQGWKCWGQRMWTTLLMGWCTVFEGVVSSSWFVDSVNIMNGSVSTANQYRCTSSPTHYVGYCKQVYLCHCFSLQLVVKV